jgi:hypothetical protein
MESAEQWEPLLEALRAACGEVEEGDGRIRLQQPHPVEIVMTPGEWDLMVDMLGDMETAVALVLRRLQAMAPEHGFIIYRDYALVPSTAPELPPDPARERLRRKFAQYPPGSLRIYAYSLGDPRNDARRDGRNDREGGPPSGPPSSGASD